MKKIRLESEDEGVPSTGYSSWMRTKLKNTLRRIRERERERKKTIA